MYTISRGLWNWTCFCRRFFSSFFFSSFFLSFSSFFLSFFSPFKELKNKIAVHVFYQWWNVFERQGIFCVYAWLRTCVCAWVCFRCYVEWSCGVFSLLCWVELWCVFVAVLSGVVVCFRCCVEWSCGVFSLLCWVELWCVFVAVIEWSCICWWLHGLLQLDAGGLTGLVLCIKHSPHSSRSMQTEDGLSNKNV